MSIGPKAVLVGDLNMLRSFKEIYNDTILVVISPDDLSRYSRHYETCKVLDIAKLSDAEVVNELVLIAKPYEERPLLYFGDDRMLFIVSRNRETLQSCYRFLISEPELIESCTDKLHFQKLARAHQLPVPSGISLAGTNDRSRLESEIGFPCVVKPAIHIDWFESSVIQDHGGKPAKMLLANNATELDYWLNQLDINDQLIVQEFIPGGEDAIYSFHTFADEESQPLAYFVGKKIRTYPSVGGVSTYLELVHDEEVVRIGLETIKKLKVKGPVKIDLKKHAINNRYYILELNLRNTLWNYLGTASGVNIPMLAYRYLSNQTIQQHSEYKTNIRWLSFGDDFRSFVRCYRAEGDYTLWSWLKSLMHKKVYDLFSWSDPLPFVVSLLRYGKALFLRLSSK